MNLRIALVLAATGTVLVQETVVRKKPQFFAPAAGTIRTGRRASRTTPSLTLPSKAR